MKEREKKQTSAVKRKREFDAGESSREPIQRRESIALARRLTPSTRFGFTRTMPAIGSRFPALAWSDIRCLAT